MYEDQTPPNGDFAAYIEARTRQGAGATMNQGMTAGAPNAATPVAGPGSVAGRRVPGMPLPPAGRTNDPTSGVTTATPGSLHDQFAMLRQEFAPLLRMVVAALVLFGVANVFDAPWSMALRVAAIFLVVLTIRRALRRTSTIRAMLKAGLARAQEEARRARAARGP